MDKNVITEVLEQISGHFGDLTVSRGNTHDFLDMDIEIKNKMVHISMKSQLEEAIEWGGTQSGKKPATPAPSNLFDKCASSNPLTLEQSDNFHSIIQKLLYICK